MKKISILALFFLTHLLSSQTSVNNYKYVIVPSKFSFTTEKDQYRLNTLTKLLLEKYGFTAYLDTDEMPQEVVNSNCNKLYADVIPSGGFIRTKLKIILKDCKNKELFTSVEGQSKDKEYRVAYNQALRQASLSFESLHYHYVSTVTEAAIQKASVPKTETVILSEAFNDTNEVLFAQPTASGFQLVDSTPKVVMKIFKTSNPTTFTAVKGTVQGILISKDTQWFFEYYQNDQLISEKVNVKF